MKSKHIKIMFAGILLALAVFFSCAEGREEAEHKDGIGFDFASGQYVNMIEEGIIDPVKVSRTALQNAASAASTLLTTNYAIIET